MKCLIDFFRSDCASPAQQQPQQSRVEHNAGARKRTLRVSARRVADASERCFCEYYLTE